VEATGALDGPGEEAGWGGRRRRLTVKFTGAGLYDSREGRI